MANEYLKRTPTSSGNRKVFTWSGWVKRNSLTDGAPQSLFTGGVNGSDRGVLDFNDTDTLRFGFNNSGSWSLTETTAKFRDPGSWMNVILSVDLTTSGNEDVSIYVNGIKISSSAVTWPSIVNNVWNAAGYGTYITSTYGSISQMYEGEMFDVFWVDGQALTPDVFGFYKDGDGYMSSGTTQATDFRNGQWVPRTPREIKNLINDNGGFGVNGFYLPMNDSSNFGADFHTTPNSIITLKGENLPQPRNGAPTTTDAYVSQLREDPYAANLVLAVPGISTATGSNLVTNGTFDTDTAGWVSEQSATLSVDNGRLKVLTTNTSYGSANQTVTGLTVGQRYTFQVDMIYGNASLVTVLTGATGSQLISGWQTADYVWRTSFTATTTSLLIDFQMASLNGVSGFWDNVILKAEDAPRDYSADIKGSGTNKTLTPNGAAGVGYEIPSYYGSALSFDGNGDYFSRTYDSDFNFGTSDFTVEMWVNPNTVNSNDGLFGVSGGSGSNPKFVVHLDNGTPKVHFGHLPGSSNVYVNSSVSIPANQWSHFAFERKGSTATWYVNGVASGVDAALSQNVTFTNQPMYIGYGGESFFNSFDGQIQDLRVYKGVAKYKGGFDVPKPYTPVGIEAFRTTADTCKNNFATWNPLDVYQNAGAGGPATLSGGNLITGSNDNKSTHSNFGVTSGKWYYESIFSQGYNNSDGLGVVAQYEKGYNGTSNGGYYILYRDNGALFIGNGTSRYDPPGGTYRSWSTYDVISVGIDIDNREVIFFNEGIEELRYPFPSHVADDAVWMPAILNRQAGYIYTNFGQNPTFSGNTTAGTYTDSNGKGLFKYQPPSGFLALCEDNLPEPTIKDPGEYFKTVLYTGDGNGGRSITGVGLKPDLVWVKRRNAAAIHFLFDSVRGAGKYSQSSSNAVEGDDATNTLMSFDSDGFTSGNTAGMNGSGDTYVAWCWKAGGESVTNTDGSIISRVSANQDAGFSIVSYTGNNTNLATVGHGLNKEVKFMITKSRTTTDDWVVHTDATRTQTYSFLNTTAALTSDSITAPSSSVFYRGTSNTINGSNLTYVSYCWAEIEGFSKFGSYVGNGNADGSFVYCGFKPAFVMLKASSTTGNWCMIDNARNSTNPTNLFSVANSSNAGDDTGGALDFLSNGFKLRLTSSNFNGDGVTYIFAAFAESPFTTANAK